MALKHYSPTLTLLQCPQWKVTVCVVFRVSSFSCVQLNGTLFSKNKIVFYWKGCKTRGKKSLEEQSCLVIYQFMSVNLHDMYKKNDLHLFIWSFHAFGLRMSRLAGEGDTRIIEMIETDMKIIGVTVKEAKDICCADQKREQQKGRRRRRICRKRPKKQGVNSNVQTETKVGKVSKALTRTGDMEITAANLQAPCVSRTSVSQKDSFLFSFFLRHNTVSESTCSSGKP